MELCACSKRIPTFYVHWSQFTDHPLSVTFSTPDIPLPQPNRQSPQVPTQPPAIDRTDSSSTYCTHGDGIICTAGVACAMDFLPKKGCPMCGIVATASQNAPQSPLTPNFAQAQQLQPEILWKDENFTAYRERANPVSSKCHIIIVFK